LADDMNITDVHLRRLESGVRAGSIELLIEFAEYFHVSLDYLILGRVSRTDKAKEELVAIKERMNYIMQLL
ncbi:MAG: helix-turn-helix transcriptional regulator, partial [Lachnospiraceae bacterium]|nr:helix-turn-helix transcriptional regulator [Lachnospiraceae bacterium]